MIDELFKTKEVIEIRVNFLKGVCNLTVKLENPDKRFYRGYRPITLKSHANNLFMACEDMLKKFDKRGLK